MTTITNVCQVCFNPYDLDLLQIQCRCPLLHRYVVPRWIFVTNDRGVLVIVRPLPATYRPRGGFIKCFDGQDCSRGDRCTFAHNNAELKLWNQWLTSERATTAPVVHRPSEIGVRRNCEGRPANPPPERDMRLPITIENYRKKFLALIYYEEIVHAELLKAKCDGYYNLVPCMMPMYIRRDEEKFQHYAYLEGMTSQQIIYGTQASDNCVYLSNGKFAIQASILSCNYNETTSERLYIGFDVRDYENLLPCSVSVKAEFRINHRYFNDLYKGVSRITKSVLKRILPESSADFANTIQTSMVNPRNSPYKHVLDIDLEQHRALDVILSCHSTPPILIPGAFGCGKTRLLAVATECFYRDCKEREVPCRVLISCHHQHSADVFMNNYFIKMLEDKKNPWPVKVVRIKRSKTSGNYDAYCMSSQSFRESFSNYKDMKYIIVVTTFGGALRMSEVVPCDYFTHMLIDEGAQTREPEALSPFLMADANTRIIIAGDDKQVGPQLVVLGEDPQRNGLCVSLMERLHAKYKSIGSDATRHAPSWNVNYRSHADILELPSTLFYESQLVACGRIPYHLKAPYPYIFICSGYRNVIPTHTYCEIEARVVLDAVHQYSDSFKSWEMKDVCIMTPSLRQANIIRKLIHRDKNHASLRGINIITSYQMQGQEYRMLFMSTVESLEPTGEPYDLLKSFCHPAVFNTAITRSKSLVVAIGNPLVLMISESTIPLEKRKWCWKEYIRRCFRHETLHIAPNEESKFREIEGQLFDILSCNDPQIMMSLFQKESYPVPKPTPAPVPSLLPAPVTVPKPRPEPPQAPPPPRSSNDLNKLVQSSPSVVGSSPSKKSRRRKRKQRKAAAATQLSAIPQQPSAPMGQSSILITAAQKQHSAATKKVLSQASAPKITQNPLSVQTHPSKVDQKQSSIAWKQPSSASAKQPNTASMKQPPPTPKTTQPAPKASPKQPPAPKASPKQPPAPEASPKQSPAPKVSVKQPSASNVPQNKHVFKPNSIQSTSLIAKMSPKQSIKRQVLVENYFSSSKISPNLSFIPNVQLTPSNKNGATPQLISSHIQGSLPTESFTKHTHQPIDKELLRAPLTRENYKRKFHQLLCREEEEHVKILKEKCDGLYVLTIVNDRYNIRDSEKYELVANINANHLDEDAKTYAIQASECQVLVSFPSGPVQADVLKGKRDSDGLYLGFKCSLRISAQQIQIFVTFILKYSYFDRLHRAIDKISDCIIDRLVPINVHDFIEPCDTPFKITRPSRNVSRIIDLDYSQTRALETIMSCQLGRAPVLVIGSFGTGKTRLLARTAYQLLSDNRTNRVLICAHHQRSVDTFITNYFAEMRKKRWFPKILRLMATGDYRCPSGCEEFYVTCRDESFLPLRRNEIRAVVTTFSTSLHLLNCVPTGFFTHILLDEGAQTREPESIAPLCLADDNTQIIIAGDHKQVGPSLLVLGETAIKHGLSTSLLERLYETYGELGNESDTHCATLLTNFRCHHALLSLPSYLFYDSALITAADTATHLHPKAKYPLHFICSSLSDAIEAKESTNLIEINLLLEQVLKYVNDWPKEWGPKDLSKICIMATTASQKRIFIKEIKTNWKYSSLTKKIKSEYSDRPFIDILIDILTVFDIQGNEFEAIFLSTAEPTTADGKSKNPTKTPCSQYVFNTALTRAKSLVVCAGNPFLLMTVEKHMNNESPCWKDYIRRCIVSKTFTIGQNQRDDPSINDKRIKELQELIFKLPENKSIDLNASQPTKDSILKSFQNELQSLPRYKYCKLQITEEQNESVWDIVKKGNNNNNDDDDDDDDDETNYSKNSPTITCELEIKDQRLAIGTPLDSSKKPVHINGFIYRKGAFNGDIVEVELFPHKEVNQEKEYGRVVKINEARHPTRYVCRCDLYGIINFYPLDKTAPCIVNLPKISLNLLKNFHDKVNKSSLQDYITVFKEETLAVSQDDNKFPQIKELIPFEVSHSLLFVVQVLGWNPKYRKALGAVIEVVPRTSNLFFTTRLLKLVYNIKEQANESNIDLPQATIEPHDKGPHHIKQVRHYNQAFTIDPPESVDLDDAISLSPLDSEAGTYELTILISNVARHVLPDSNLSQIAEAKGTSVYGKDEVIHMLPKCVAESLSLNYNVKRDVLCVSSVITTNSEGNVTQVTKCSNTPHQGTMTSQVRLTYKTAKQIMNGEHVDNEGTNQQLTQFNQGSSLCMKETLELLYKTAMKLRINRLGFAAYSYDVSDPGEEDNWQTHLLIEELMIWTNSIIATFLHDNIPQLTLLRCQLSPLSDDMTIFTETNSSHLSNSLSLQRYYSHEPCTPLIVPNSTLKLIHTACTNSNPHQLRWLLSNDRLYPQLAIALDSLHSICKNASYIVTGDEHTCDNHIHSGLSLKSYTHFTSPIRRYFDLVVQRLLIALIEKADISYTVEELKKLCSHLNMKSKLAKEYERKYIKVHLTRECELSSIKTEAFVTVSLKKQNQFELCLNSNQFQSIHGRDTHFKSSHLNSHHNNSNNTVVWHVLSMSFKAVDCLFTHPDIQLVTSSTSQEQSSSFITATVYHYNKEEEGKEEKQLIKSSMKFKTADRIKEFTPDVWKLAHKFIKSSSNDDFEQIKTHFTPPDTLLEPSQDRPPSCCFNHNPVIIYDIERSFKSGEVIDVWLNKSLKEPLPTPSIQLIEIAPTVRVCLQHNQHPAFCFSNVQLQNASRENYHSIKEYVELWSQVLVAEAANVGVSTKSLMFIRDANLQWPELKRIDNCVDDVYYQPNGNIQLIVPAKKRDSLDFIQIKSGDFICARYEVKNGLEGDILNAVYHFVVLKKDDDNQGTDDVRIEMIAEGDQSCRVTQEMANIIRTNKILTCDLQVIPMPDSFNRVYSRLKRRNGKSPWSSLALSIATGSGCLNSNTESREYSATKNILDNDPLSKHVWESVNVQLNSVQIESIKRALRHKFQLIQGPPGTGKSVTGAHLAYIFSKANKQLVTKDGRKKVVIYCGPSNKSVDVVHEKLRNLNKNHLGGAKMKILRIYGRTHERKVYPDPCHNLTNETPHDDDHDKSENGASYKIKEGTGRCLEEFREDALHFKIRYSCPDIIKKEKRLLKLLDEGIIPTLSDRKDYKDCVILAERNELKKNDYDIILCTCNETCSPRMLTLVEEDRISQCIIDECGMAHEPETIAAASLCEHVVLIGDHKQLQPVIKYPQARECGLGVSLFERYANIWGKDDNPQLITLEIQYRMHRFICKGPSECFYDNQLKADKSVISRLPLTGSIFSFWLNGLKYPLLFHNVYGEENLTDSKYSRDVDSHSKCNGKEADIVLDYIKTLTTSHKVKFTDIAVLTPYAAQKKLIIDKIKEDRSLSWINPTVATIAESQGDEYNIVILTTVRSQRLSEIKHRKFVQPDRKWMRENLGFLTDEHQVNVGITRAKHGLIIVGNKILLEYDDTWRKLIELYNINGCIKSNR